MCARCCVMGANGEGYVPCTIDGAEAGCAVLWDWARREERLCCRRGCARERLRRGTRCKCDRGCAV
eukprot:2389991-Rhodomonas_salina.1